ncbi:MAG: porin, partial [Porticoccus sp.]
MYKKLLATIIGLNIATAAYATPSLEEMWTLIQQQQAEISQLKTELSSTEERITQTEVKTEATFAAVEEVTAGPVAKLADWADKTSVGGYGELHYNNLSSDNSDATKDEMDLHRFVVFFGHQYSEDLRFFSELEVEHSLVKDTDDGS